jgi:uncharacterized protein (DUF1800 family)
MRSSSLFFVLRPVAAGLLVVQLALPAVVLGQEPEMQTHAAQPAASERLGADAAAIQVLNRFTYGPRPGDIERLKAIGVKEWFRQQFKPETIDDSALEARLAAYPAMNLPLDRLMEMYPTNNVVRASLNRQTYIPGGDAAHAIYRDQQEQYANRKAKKANGGDMADGDVALPDSASNILALPPDKRFKEICHLTLPQLRQLRQSLAPEERGKLTEGFTPQQMEALAAFTGPGRVVAAEDVQVKLMRDIYSERQLQEVMVDFWLNHFNVYMKKSQQSPYFISAYVRQSIRPYALSNFTQLLMATATSPAMLNYLDNSESVGPHSEYATHGAYFRGQGQGKAASGLNENYARELMELHTVGVNGGYTQKDVTEVAKVFTGWTVGRQFGEDQDNVATFDPTKHEPGDKMVMGHKIKQDGEKEGIEVLKLLASSPECARFISTKLAVRFVSDDPPKAMIDRMTGEFLETHGDIRHVLVAMVNSPEFFTQEVYRSKVKTPQDFVVSAVRAAGADVQSTAALVEAISDLGMPIYGMQTPNGYSMKSEAWNSTTALVSRMNFALALASNRVQGVKTDFDSLLGPDAATMTPQDKDRVLEGKLLHVAVSDRTEQLIEAQTSADTAKQVAELRQVSEVGKRGDPLQGQPLNGRNTDPSLLDTQAAVAAGLIFGSPEFQRR